MARPSRRQEISDFMRSGVRSVRAEKGIVKIVVVNRVKHAIRSFDSLTNAKGNIMNSIVYIVGAIVIIVALLSFLGLR